MSLLPVSPPIGGVEAVVGSDKVYFFSERVPDGVNEEGIPLRPPSATEPMKGFVPLFSDKPHDAEITSCAFGGGCRYLAAASRDMTISVYDIGRDFVLGARTALRTYQDAGGCFSSPAPCGHQAPITALAFNLDASFLASGDSEGQIVIWSMKTRKQLCKVPAFDKMRIPVACLAFSAANKNLLLVSTESDTGAVAAFDIALTEKGATCKPAPAAGKKGGSSSIKAANDMVPFIATHAGARIPDILITASLDGTITNFDLSNRREVGATIMGEAGGFTAAIIFQNLNVVGVSDSGAVGFFDILSGDKVAAAKTAPLNSAHGDKGVGVCGFSFPKQGGQQCVLSVGADGSVQFWSVVPHPKKAEQGLVIPAAAKGQLPLDNGRISSCCCCSSTNTIAFGTEAGAILLYYFHAVNVAGGLFEERLPAVKSPLPPNARGVGAVSWTAGGLEVTDAWQQKNKSVVPAQIDGLPAAAPAAAAAADADDRSEKKQQDQDDDTSAAPVAGDEGLDVATAKQRLALYYQKFDPGKLPNVERNVEKYKDNLPLMFNSLVSKCRDSRGDDAGRQAQQILFAGSGEANLASSKEQQQRAVTAVSLPAKCCHCGKDPSSAAAPIQVTSEAEKERQNTTRVTMLQNQLRQAERHADDLHHQVEDLRTRLALQEREYQRKIRDMERQLVLSQSWQPPAQKASNPLEVRGYAENSDLDL